MKKCVAECFGTFALVFAGTGAIIVNDISGGAVTHVGIALTFGLIVMTMIYSLGDISGAHFNPAVTLGFWMARRLSGRSVIPYIASQGIGAVAASLLLRILFIHHPTLGLTAPSGSVFQAFIFEMIMTLFLMFVILNVSTGSKEKGLMAGAAIGSVVLLDALFGGTVSGASMNPARSLAPALVTGHFDSLWLYIIAPILGAASAVVGCRCVQERGCCTS